MPRRHLFLPALLLPFALAASARGQTPPEENLDEGVVIRTIEAGPFRLGEERPKLDLTDFPVSVDGAAAGLDARWVPDSVQWVRAPDELALPRARLRVSLDAAPERASLQRRGRAVLFQDENGKAVTELFVPLFTPGAEEIRVVVDGQVAGTVRVARRADLARPASARHAIDHSCTPWNLSFQGMDDSYLTASCRMVPVGPLLGQEPYLEVLWTAPDLTLPGGAAFPLTTALRDGRPARLTATGSDGKPRVVELSGSVPARLPRLRLAGGVGPYRLTTSAGSGNGAAASVMLYGNFRIKDNVSIRGFEAAVSQSPANTALFNNFGVYFAYDLKHFWDGRGRLVALLGAQGLTFAPRGFSGPSFNEVIVPQGFEFSYLNAFGRRNETLSGGLFAQPSTTTPYQNYWIRYGRRWFGELNYISWRSYERSAKMWGVSVGFPLAQLL